MNLKVGVFKRVRTAKGLRYCPVVEAANGRIKPHAVVVDGREEKHPEGAYYISWYEQRRVRRLAVGNDPVEAKNRRDRKAIELQAVAKGVAVIPEKKNGHHSINAAIASFLEGKQLTKKPKTFAAYDTSMRGKFRTKRMVHKTAALQNWFESALL